MGVNALLTLGALILIGMFMLSANSLMSDNTMAAQQNELLLTSISMAQSLIDEAKTKAFDQKSVAVAIIVPDSLSATLGRDGGAEAIALPDTLSPTGYQSSLHFNDVDDYNGYSRTIRTPRAEGYIVSATVHYANESAPDSLSASRTFCKTMVVTVSNSMMAGPVTLHYAFVY